MRRRPCLIGNLPSVPRPSNSAERREQVLSAYMRAIALHGMSGATLDVISKEAGLKRPLVRHHLGNKHAMFDQLVEHVVTAFENRAHDVFGSLPDGADGHALIERLFQAAETGSPELVYVFAELTFRSGADAGLASRLSKAIATFESLLKARIRATFPNRPDDAVDAAAHGVLAIYFNAVSLAPLGLDAATKRNSRRAATALLMSLMTDGDAP